MSIRIQDLLPNLRPKIWLRLYLLFAAFLVIKVMLNQHGWVNNDSLLYFEQARLIATGEWKQAFNLFSWILYPSLIAWIHVSTGLDIQTSAQCLNTIFFVLFVAGFQQLLIVAGANMRTLHWAHLLLFSTPYIVGSALGMLLRDEGFWAAYTWGLVYWLRYTKSETFKHTISFQCCFLIALLFRIEASAYLLALPFLALLTAKQPWHHRFKIWLQSNLLVITIAVFSALALLFNLIEIHHLGRLQETFTRIVNIFTERIDFINQKAELLGNQILGEDLDEYGQLSLWSSLFLITTIKTLKVVGVPCLLVLLWPKRIWWSSLSKNTKYFSLTVLAISFIVSIVIMLNVLVLSSRYVIATGIVMLLLAAFAMSDLQRRWSTWVTRLYAMILILMLINTLWDHEYLDLDRLAVNYIASANHSHKSVFYDTENARFYANQPYLDRIHGRFLFKELIANNKIENYEYYLISVSKDDVDKEYQHLVAQTLNAHHYVLIKTIYGWHKKSKAFIYTKEANLKNKLERH